jgi:integrase
MARVTDWTGITRTATGYLVRVHVRPLPMASKRFPPHATLRSLQAWRDDTRRALERDRAARITHAGTLAADVADYLSRWGAGKHPETVAQRRRHLEQWASAFPGRTRHSVAAADIEQQLSTWQAAGEGAATWNKRRQALYQLFEVLDRGTDRRNPVKVVPTHREPRATARGLPVAVVRELLLAMPPSKTRARLGVMAFTGLRPEEVRRLTPADRDATRGTLFVRSAKGSPAATVPLLAEASRWLDEFAALDAFGPFGSAPMNLSLRRAVVAVNAVRAQAGRELLPEGITAYTMRHTFGTEFYRVTRDLKATKEAMRHASLSMTERYIGGAVSAVLAAGVAAVEAAASDHQRDHHGASEVGKTGRNRKVPGAGAKGSQGRISRQ